MSKVIELVSSGHRILTQMSATLKLVLFSIPGCLILGHKQNRINRETEEKGEAEKCVGRWQQHRPSEAPHCHVLGKQF